VTKKNKNDKNNSSSQTQKIGTAEELLQITMTSSDYEVMMSLLSFGLRTFAEVIKSENEKGNIKDAPKYDASLKKYVEIFQKLDDAGNPDLGEDRILH
jgi:hypothetical protein